MTTLQSFVPVDEILARRIRRRIRSFLRPPWHLSVAAHDGQVVLSGALLPEDLPRVLDAVAHMDGVVHVQHHLTIRER